MAGEAIAAGADVAPTLAADQLDVDAARDASARDTEAAEAAGRATLS